MIITDTKIEFEKEDIEVISELFLKTLNLEKSESKGVNFIKLRQLKNIKHLFNNDLVDFTSLTKQDKHNYIRLISKLTEMIETLELWYGITTEGEIKQIAKQMSNKWKLPIGIIN